MASEGQVWDVSEFKTAEKKWSERSSKEKLIFGVMLFVKFVLMLLLLYLFIISLDLMSNSFRIFGGKTAGRTFRNSDLFDNPLAGLVIGIIVTVLVQSSSTSTSIIITMTAGDLIEIRNAIPMIMGANIGTSVTNTIVSMGSLGDANEYRRAFAGATVHDCFNYLTVLVLLPVEVATGVLRRTAAGICERMDITDKENKGANTDFLKKLTKPVASRLLAIDKGLITKIAQERSEAKLKEYDDKSIIKHSQEHDQHIFLDTQMSDGVAGALMLFVSLTFLCICLVMLVKLLQSIFRGRIAIWFRRVLNLEIHAIPFLADYVLIFFAMCITILFQSSSVTTSTLTPLVGIGLVRIDKMFAFTIGANLGTTITGILSALVSDKRKTGLTVAFSHTLFNIIGFLIWYPIPIAREVPIRAAKVLGNISAGLPWFPVVYIAFMFGILPLALLGLSLANPFLASFVGIPLILTVIVAFVITGMRQEGVRRLPGCLRANPSWLPECLMFQTEAETSGTVEATTASSAGQTQTKEADADLGKDRWEGAPAAWGGAWFVTLALLVVIFNCQWAMLKYASWDKRDHFGVGAWTVCSNAFEKEQRWAPMPVHGSCTDVYLASCGALKDCKNLDFSSIGGAHKAYQTSWSNCRGKCSSARWGAWCEELNCAGNLHAEQCSNVTNAVQGIYNVSYEQVGSVAWSPGKRCRDVNALCPGMGGIVEVPGDLALLGWIFDVVGLIALLSFQFMRKKNIRVLYVSVGCFLLAWLLLLASWATWAWVVKKQTTCIVEAESRTGAVWARGKFGDIFNAGAYAFGFVVGSWALLPAVMLLIVLRIKKRDETNQNSQARDSLQGGPAAVPDAEI